MYRYNKVIRLALPFIMLLAGCKKLDENLGSTFTSSQITAALGAAGPNLLLQTAYTDAGNTFSSVVLGFALEEVSSDEFVVPTRGGDWFANGLWIGLYLHTWDVNQPFILPTFNDLNKLNFDATNVLAFNPTKGQAAEARFLRALALYRLLDLFGQFPYRNAGDNLLNASEVKSGADAVNYIISELTTILPDLDPNNSKTLANRDAVNTLLMHCYLQKGAFINRAAPTFDDADMQKVISIGNAIISSGKYSYTPDYFDNFTVNNGTTSKEGIFAYPNHSGVSAGNSGISGLWVNCLHYNQFTPFNPGAGANGFSTTSDFYNSFSLTGVTTFGPADTLLDQRIGGRYNVNSTPISGLKSGFLVGQQYNEKGAPEKDRRGNLLAFDPAISPNLVESGPNLELTGIRVLKYIPDFSNGGIYFRGPAGNWQMIFRYPDVVLMVAEAKLRSATPDVNGALVLINGLRTARSAPPVASMPLVNPAWVNDPKTLLAERGREFYWEGMRRTDLIRFGVYLKPWQYKPASDPKTLLFPVPPQALASNLNLKQNPGY